MQLMEITFILIRDISLCFVRLIINKTHNHTQLHLLYNNVFYQRITNLGPTGPSAGYMQKELKTGR